jgi:abhydrolase domain-containing protein 6
VNRAGAWSMPGPCSGKAAALAAAVLCAGCAAVPGPAAAGGSPPWTEVTAAGLRIAALDAGPADATLTILAVHGWGGSAIEFAPLLPFLPANLRFVAPDLPGTGRSESAPAYSMELFVSVLRDLSERAGPVVLVGHSLGGKVAVTFASRYPQRVRALVLLAPYGLEGQEGAFLGWVARSRRLSRLGASLNNRLFIRWSMATRSYYDAAAVPREVKDHVVASQVSAGGRGAMAAVAGAMIGRDPIDALLPALTMPTLIIWGRQDRVLPITAAERYRSSIAGSRLVVLEGCGHVATAERPIDVNRELLKLIAGLRRL